MSQFNQTWKAVKSAANLMDKNQLSKLGFSNKEELFSTIKQSYVRNLFPDVNAVGFDIKKHAGKMAKLSLFDRRRRRVRSALKARSAGRPRLSVHRSGKHIYAQVIDDEAGRTVASASSVRAAAAGFRASSGTRSG